LHNIDKAIFKNNDIEARTSLLYEKVSCYFTNVGFFFRKVEVAMYIDSGVYCNFHGGDSRAVNFRRPARLAIRCYASVAANFVALQTTVSAAE